MPEINNILPNKTLIDLHKWLIRRALSQKLPMHIVEELVNDTLLKVCETYDPGRGYLKAYSWTILKNKIRNHIRRETKPVMKEFDDELFWMLEDPEKILLNEENLMTVREFLDTLRHNLSDEELRFFLNYEETLEDLGRRVVTETARRLGIQPEEGINIMKRIVRKAKYLRKLDKKIIEMISSEQVNKIFLRSQLKPSYCIRRSLSFPEEIIDDNLLISIARFENRLYNNIFDNFWQNLSREQKLKLSSLY